MGFGIKAAITISTGAALLGLAKVYKASQMAAQGVTSTGQAAAKAKSPMLAFVKTMADVRDFRQMITGKVVGSTGGLTQKFTGVGARGGTGGQWGRGGGGGVGGPAAAVTGTVPQGDGVWEATAKKWKLAMSSLRAVTFAAREARGWIKLLFGETEKGKTGGIKRLGDSVKRLVVDIKFARRGMSEMAKSFNEGLQAIGGGRLVGAGLVMDAFNLARAAEDASVTFDTMLGSADKSAKLVTKITQFAAKTPFQKSDIIEASRRLLTVTGDNVDENERLFKLAANIAALKPGSSVEEVARGLVSASMGEFEILKGTFGIPLSAKMFTEAGDTGGDAYTKAVFERVEKTFKSRTGGRDLVGALSTTTTGLMSTLKDSVELPLELIGRNLIKKLGVKEFFGDAIRAGEEFFDILEALLLGDPMHGNAPPAMVAFATAIRDVIDKAVMVKDFVFGVFRQVFDWFASLSPAAQKQIIGIGVAVAGIASAAALVVPQVLGVVAVAAAAWGPVSAGLAAISGAIGVLLGPIGWLALAFGAFFLLFRRDGEGALDTFFRLAYVVKDLVVGAFARLMPLLQGVWTGMKTALQPAWDAFMAAVSELRQPLSDIMSVLFATSTTGEQFAGIGYMIGEVIGWLVAKPLKWLAGLVQIVASVFEVLNFLLTPLISDFQRLGAVTLDFFLGTGNAYKSFKILMLGLADLMTYPFRTAIAFVLLNLRGKLQLIEGLVRPFSERIADRIAEQAEMMRTTANTINEGFLETKRAQFTEPTIKVEADIKAKATTPVAINIDGNKVAESQAVTEMRTRNSGRGGDPMTPEELGFVLEQGRVRTVGLAEVASRS